MNEKQEIGRSGPEPRARHFSVRARLRSFGYALAGGQVLLRDQHNAWIHALATGLVCVLALTVGLSRWEWCVVILAMALVWAMEAINTAVELLADEVSLEHRPLIGRAKDVAAFGVLVAAAAAVLVGLLVFLPHFLRL